jgi:membrane fusion protein (multidrug efflux system)
MKSLAVVLATVIFMPSVVSGEDRDGAPPPVRVVVAPISEETVAENTPITGVIYYDKVSSLSTEVAGLVKSVHFREGNRVQQGDTLLTLNTDFIDKNIELAKTKMEQIALQIERTEKDLGRFESLYQQEAVAEREYDDIFFKRLELVKQRETLGKELDIALLKRDKSVIHAPFDGIVLSKSAEVGNWVDPGDELCRIGSSDDVFAKVSVAEELLRYSGEGEAVHVIINAFQMNLKGTISDIMPVADPRTKNVMLKIQLPRMETVVENMSATVFISTSERKRLKLVPRDALVTIQGKDLVYTVKDGRAVPVPIRVVSYVGEFAGIEKSDFPDGMMVVVDGNQRLRPDQPVEIIEIISGENPS